MKYFFVTVTAAALLCVPIYAAEVKPPPAQQNFKTLDGQVQSLKQEVLELNRDLFVLEEELLFPATTQVAVFVSMDVGKIF